MGRYHEYWNCRSHLREVFFLREAAGLKDFRFQRGLAPIAVLYWLVSFKVHLWQKAEETSSVYHFLSSLVLCIFKKEFQNIFTTFRSMTASKWQIFQNSVEKKLRKREKNPRVPNGKKDIYFQSELVNWEMTEEEKDKHKRTRPRKRARGQKRQFLLNLQIFFVIIKIDQ